MLVQIPTPLPVEWPATVIPSKLAAGGSAGSFPSLYPAQQNALHIVLEQHLLKATGNGYYQLHAIVTNYAQSHFDENDEQINQQILRSAHHKASAYYLQQAATTCPPKDQRRHINDIHPLLEALWQSCQARQWQKAFDLVKREGIFSGLKRWGGMTHA